MISIYTDKYYQVDRLNEDSIDALREMFPEGKADSMIGATTRINPAGFLAALERTGYRVSAESSFDKPSGAIDAAAGVLGPCGLAEALAGPAWLRRFHSAAVKAFAVAEDREFVNTLKAEEGDDDNS